MNWCISFIIKPLALQRSILFGQTYLERKWSGIGRKAWRNITPKNGMRRGATVGFGGRFWKTVLVMKMGMPWTMGGFYMPLGMPKFDISPLNTAIAPWQSYWRGEKKHLWALKFTTSPKPLKPQQASLMQGSMLIGDVLPISCITRWRRTKKPPIRSVAKS